MRANAVLINIEGTDSHGDRQNIAKQDSMTPWIIQPFLLHWTTEALTTRHGMPVFRPDWLSVPQD